jgi:ribonuclease III
VDDTLEALAGRIGHRFTNPGLLHQAMRHRSWCSEHGEVGSYERLEFLGDAVLGWVVADLVFCRFPDLDEGDLTDLRKSVVNAATLAEIAEELSLGDAVLLGKGEAAAGGSAKPSILSDAAEAVIGAVYMDSDAPTAHALVVRMIGDRLEAALAGLANSDYKTQLQEASVGRFGTPPTYAVTDTGPDHAKEFSAVVLVSGREMGRGVGRSKKAAEQQAAAEALRSMGDGVGADVGPSSSASREQSVGGA